MIKISNVRKEFEDLEVIKGLNLHIQKGSIYGLLGSNGAGKTTLLKLIAGIYKQDAGDILINDEPVFENVNVKKKLIFMPDALYFFPHTSIQQMAHFYKHIYPSWNEERFQKLKEVFQIDVHKKIHRLSKGMQRQVAFWLAFSAMPDVFVLDEPLDGLDAVMRQKVKNLLVQDVAEREMTVVISSHNLREVEDLCDSIGIMHKGELIIEKALDDLKSDVHKIQVAFKGNVPLRFLEGLNVLYKEQRGSVLLSIVRGKEEHVVSHVKKFEPAIFDLLPLTLEEIFIYEMGDVGYAIENIIV
ncbi:ABC-2 type transport system ATP-binding protein [Anoxybacillus vitaminiphilus]|uniref:ABC-2 type transport system ATP-binding protein n=1 Tax=Paranoxybacillus vitaminiphilus TaxID=581036 RepID=A0A327YF03_9BACL|nr:ABC transporter ATP-binding protein [Anoxybacillus vitaminiphilus]RAK18395.1 ABC-2 type transport system ATP-binding protein [Anoxybacillus vitaminiphilus]